VRASSYNEAASAVERGHAFTAKRLRLAGVTLLVLSDARRYLSVADRLAAEVIESGDRLRERYLADGHDRACARPEDVLYMVTRDERALAAITRGGQLRLNRELPSGQPRFALERLLPALHTQAARRAETMKTAGMQSN
jgi:hypothetical protein